MKRNSLVVIGVLAILAIFAWAGWANWEYRKQAAERRQAAVPQVELIPATSGGAPQVVSPLMGKAAPDFALEDLSGKKVTLSSYKGKAVLINFWATWCGPCKIETPWLIDLRNQYAGQGFEILGVSADDIDRDNAKLFASEKKDIAKFVEQQKMPYPVLIEGDKVSKPYGGLDSLPMSFFVDRKGTVVAVQVGLTSASEIEANIRKSLGGAM